MSTTGEKLSAAASPPASAPSTMPPVAAVDEQDKAMRLRKATLKSLNKLAGPALKKWVVDCLADDIQKAAG